MSNIRLNRSGGNLSAQVLLQGGAFTLRPITLIVLGVGLAGMGVFGSSTVVVLEDEYGPLFAMLGAGVVPALLIGGGLLYGPAVHLEVTDIGVSVNNPLRTAKVPWEALTGARVGTFGLRLQSHHFEFPVFAAQANNWEELRKEADRDLEKLARRLIEVRKDMLDAPRGSSEQIAGEPLAVKRWRSVWPAVAGVSAYTLLVGLYVYLW